jgi:antitoxin component HigA of HigAB toxin-antitoxin module
MDIKPIKTHRDYRRILKEIKSLMNAKRDTPKGGRLGVLVTLVEAWEARHYDIVDALAARKVEASLAAGREELLNAEETAALVAAPTPLAFWRKKRGKTQSQLAAEIGVSNRRSTISRRRASKYPPAEPGALGCEPLEAAVGAADAAPDRVRHLKVAHQRHRFICSRRLSSSSCFLMYSRIISVSRPQHVHVIQQKITFLDLAFLLLG